MAKTFVKIFLLDDGIFGFENRVNNYAIENNVEIVSITLSGMFVLVVFRKGEWQ